MVSPNDELVNIDVPAEELAIFRRTDSNARFLPNDYRYFALQDGGSGSETSTVGSELERYYGLLYIQQSIYSGYEAGAVAIRARPFRSTSSALALSPVFR